MAESPYPTPASLDPAPPATPGLIPEPLPSAPPPQPATPSSSGFFARLTAKLRKVTPGPAERPTSTVELRCLQDPPPYSSLPSSLAQFTATTPGAELPPTKCPGYDPAAGVMCEVCEKTQEIRARLDRQCSVKGPAALKPIVESTEHQMDLARKDYEELRCSLELEYDKLMEALAAAKARALKSLDASFMVETEGSSLWIGRTRALMDKFAELAGQLDHIPHNPAAVQAIDAALDTIANTHLEAPSVPSVPCVADQIAPFELLGKIVHENFTVPIVQGKKQVLPAAGLFSPSGRILAAGRNSHGQLGLGHTERTEELALLKFSPLGVRKVAPGDGFVFFLLENGELRGCGSNQAYQLGQDLPTPFVSSPIVLELPAGKVSDIASGSSHAVALCYDGSLYLWGSDCSAPHLPRPIPFFFDHHVKSISAGDSFTVCLLDNLTECYAWGRNNYGEVGNGKTQPVVEKPSLVLMPEGTVLEFSCGKHHTLAITTEGVYAWGRGTEGQIGDGQLNNRSLPTRVTELPWKGITHVSAGESTSVAVGSSGELWTWGARGSSSALRYEPASETEWRSPHQISGHPLVDRVRCSHSWSGSCSLSPFQGDPPFFWGSSAEANGPLDLPPFADICLGSDTIFVGLP